MAFQFGFAGGDDDDDDDDDVATGGKRATSCPVESEPIPLTKQHKLEDLVGMRHFQCFLPEIHHCKFLQELDIPSRVLGAGISSLTSTVRVESPLGKVVHLPRRELFDVRVQLLQENATNDTVIDQLENSDIRAGVYEGGFKTWECSLDLVSLLLDRGPHKNMDDLSQCNQVAELGAGSALPTISLFRHAMENAILGITFTLADYNEEVLRLVTLPNLLLNWAAVTCIGNESIKSDESNKGDLEVTPELVSRFIADLKCKSTSINLLSGPWSSSLASLIPLPAQRMGLIVLATETIYSPDSTMAFVDLLTVLLKRVNMAKAVIGAKRFYFGVGGSVDSLKEICRKRGARASEIENHGVPGMDRGVGRVLLEIQIN